MRLRHLTLSAALLSGCGPAQESPPPVVVAVTAPEPAQPIATSEVPHQKERDPAPSAPAASRDPVMRVRDPRKATGAPRTPEILTVEIEQLERLFATLSRSAPDRPMLLRRIAEEYVELARTLRDRGNEGSKAASQKAIAHYASIVADHPSYGQKDDVFYYAGLENELTGDLRQARTLYYELIKTSPQSKHIPGAYFAFGEMFFAESDRDPSKLALAEQAYSEALKYPPPANALYGVSLARAAEVADRSGNAQKAAQLRTKLDQLPASDPAKALRRP